MGINFNRAEFVLSAVNAANFVRDGRPQVTFAGRSNVGKSSVINRILNRKNFARVGATPGKTTQINYFRIDDKIYFTDLPGYGYAKVSKGERDRWGMLMERYFAEAGLVQEEDSLLLFLAFSFALEGKGLVTVPQHGFPTVHQGVK